MASISRDNKGWRVQWMRDGKRATVRLGQVSERTAAYTARHVESLLLARRNGAPPDPATATWLEGVGDALHARLASLGLVQARLAPQTTTLGALLKMFMDTADVKPATRVRMEQAVATLITHFGEGRDAATISEADADEWRTGLRAKRLGCGANAKGDGPRQELRGYSAATVSRTVLYARQFFRWGMKRRLVRTNPFADLKAGAQVNPARQVFVDRETIAKVIEAAPDAEWRLLIALSRYGGLRVPSEALSLTWQDVDWERNRLRIRSPKTEHHEGKGERLVPLFPEVREYLQAVYDAAPVGSTFVVERYREGCNLNPQLHRIVKRAGLKAWPRLWHNLRASRATELVQQHPAHVAAAWLGHAAKCAAEHYLTVTGGDFEKAVRGQVVQQVVQSGAEMPGSGRKPNRPSDAESPDFAGAFECVPICTDSTSGQGRT